MADRRESLVRLSRGSVLIVVLVTLVFATAALLLFVERASTDLLVYVRDADRMRLRQEAYSALETTLAVLVDFEEVLDGLHSPDEGWVDPLGWVGYEPGDGVRAEVTFEDESGKISIARVDFQTLYDLFLSWGRTEDESELWADALLGWMQEDYQPRSYNAPEAQDYETAEPSFLPPGRPIHSFQELRAIDVIREAFFDDNGLMNETGRRFAAAVSLFDFSKTNVNGAPGSVLAAIGRYDERQQALMNDYRAGEGIYRGNNKGYFTSQDQLNAVLGETAGAQGFGTAIQALRIVVTVSKGKSSYRLNVVVAPRGGASLLAGDPLPRKETTGGSASPADADEAQTDDADKPTGSGQRRSAAELAAAEGDESQIEDIEYPFTLLEIREIDAPPMLADAAPSPEI